MVSPFNALHSPQVSCRDWDLGFLFPGFHFRQYAAGGFANICQPPIRLLVFGSGLFMICFGFLIIR